MKFIYILILLLSIYANDGLAACNSQCTNCSPADGNGTTIQSCISNAANGAIIKVPAGSYTGNFTLDGTKALSIIGAGGSGGTTEAGTITVNTQGNNFIRISGFTFTVGTYAISIWGKGTAWRIDNNYFTSSNPGPDIQVDGTTYGVIDHNTWTNSVPRQSIFVFQNSYNNRGTYDTIADGGYSSMISAAPLGTSQAVFAEDNTFTYTTPQTGYSVMDTRSGGRIVFRHNTVTNNSWSTHDGEIGREHGVRTYEVYDNTFIITQPFQASMEQFRGGTGVIYNNQFKAYNCSGPVGNCYTQAGTPIIANANRTPSGYTSVGDPWLSACNSTVKNFCLGGAPKSCTTSADCTGDAVSPCVQLDGYQNTSVDGGWPCRDQIGTGQTDPTTGVQTSDPLYLWGNVYCFSSGNSCTPSTAVVMSNNGDNTIIQLNRDYYESTSTAKPGYAPYTYPHPLTSALPGPPINLIVK